MIFAITQRAVSQDAGIASRGENIFLFLQRGSREKCVKAATSRSRQHVSGHYFLYKSSTKTDFY